MQDTNIPWTDAELKILSSSLTHGEVAEKIGRSYTAVRVKRKRLGVVRLESGVTGVLIELEPEPDTKKADYWRTECGRLQRKIETLSKVSTATEVLAEEARALAPLSYNSAPEWPTPLKKSAKPGTAQSAVLMLSDTHVGAVVRPEQTLGFGEYNFLTFLRRLKRVEQSVISILQDHTTTAVPELVIPMLGDMIDGALTHSAEAGQLNTLFSQFYGAGHAIAQFLRNLSPLVPKIRVYTCVGNHPRWANQHKMPTKNRFSNLDHFLYAYIEALVRDIPKIEFKLNRQPWAEFQVQGFNFLAAHGDHLRGGDKALGIPSHSIGRNVSAAAQMRLKVGRPGINYYLLGHLHRAMELTHSGGQILINGGFPGMDEYGMTESFVAADPIQKFFLVHPKHGRSACYDLNLRHAATDGTPYEIPGEFPLV